VVTCEDENSHKYFEGATWSVGSCIQCTCQNGKIYCTRAIRIITSKQENITESCNQTICNVANYVEVHLGVCKGMPLTAFNVAKRTITKNRFVSVRSHETPRTESDKHCDQNKANVWAADAVVSLKAKILVNSSVYRSRNKRKGGHQTLLLGWVQNRLKISRKMAGIA